MTRILTFQESIQSRFRLAVTFCFLVLFVAVSNAQEITAVRLQGNPIIRPEMLPPGDGDKLFFSDDFVAGNSEWKSELEKLDFFNYKN